MEHVFEAVKSGQMLQLCTSRGCSTALVRLIPKQAGEFGIVGEAGGLLQLAGRGGQFVNFNGKEGSPSTTFAACIQGETVDSTVAILNMATGRWLSLTDSGVLNSSEVPVGVELRPSSSSPPARAARPVVAELPHYLKSPILIPTEAGDLCTPWAPVLRDDPLLPPAMPVARMAAPEPVLPLSVNQMIEFGEEGFTILKAGVAPQLTQAAMAVINDELTDTQQAAVSEGPWRERAKEESNIAVAPWRAIQQHSTPVSPGGVYPAAVSSCSHGHSHSHTVHSHACDDGGIGSIHPHACDDGTRTGAAGVRNRAGGLKTKFPKSSQAQEIDALLYESSVLEAVEQLMGPANVKPHGGAVQVEVSSWDWEQYGCTANTPGDQWKLEALLTPTTQPAWNPFSLYVGVALTDVEEINQGNLTVFPRSHNKLLPLLKKVLDGKEDTSKFFNLKQPGKPDCGLGEMLMLEAGDVVLLHSKMAHRYAPHIVPKLRYMVFFKLDHLDLPSLCRSGRILDDTLAEFEPVRAAMQGGKVPEQPAAELPKPEEDDTPAIQKIGTEWVYKNLNPHPDATRPHGCYHSDIKCTDYCQIHNHPCCINDMCTMKCAESRKGYKPPELVEVVAPEPPAAESEEPPCSVRSVGTGLKCDHRCLCRLCLAQRRHAAGLSLPSKHQQHSSPVSLGGVYPAAVSSCSHGHSHSHTVHSHAAE